VSLAGSLLVALALAALALVGAGRWAERRRAPVGPDAPGRIVALPEGRVHLRDSGGAGPVVVCVHGLSTPGEVWAGLAPVLAADGVRVLAPDLWGRGWSDRPARAHDLDLYAAQIAGLLDALGIAGPVRLVGYSMGGAVVAAFADRHPARTAGIALLAPAGFRHGLRGLYAVAARLPLLGDAAWSLRGGALLRAEARAEAAHWPDLPAILARETGRRGYLPALLSALRHALGRPLDAVHARIAVRGTPVLAVWGERDAVIPPAGRDRLAAANPAAAQVVIDGAGHGLVYTHRAQVGAALRRWLGET